jgi:hypothetical protein
MKKPRLIGVFEDHLFSFFEQHWKWGITNLIHIRHIALTGNQLSAARLFNEATTTGGARTINPTSLSGRHRSGWRTEEMKMPQMV